ncbi:NAD(P)-binding oxidoreductase [Corynebacterium sp. L4756]|uniref:NAD(P)-binding oxidoreductase n=1 Tax=unclassified Corynebacterium TaxID=2624378 RepID=UPI00374DC9EB
MTDSKKVLYIGGHGKIGLLTTPKLIEGGHEVHSLVRNPDYKAKLEGLGATPVIADITELTAQDWAKLAEGFDYVVWGAGNGGRGGAELTFAVDQDGAIAAVEGLESLGDKAPRLIMISYMGATQNEVENDGGSWYAYVESKKNADNRINSSSLDSIILGPGVLTDDAGEGIRIVEPGAGKDGDGESPRDLVANVIAEIINKDEVPPHAPLEFFSGDRPLAAIWEK